jgi:hypothetical protein
MSSKALEMGVCFHSDPDLGDMEGHFFLVLLTEKILFRDIFVRTSKDM